ncbi:hypothetical protein HQQ81_20580 [Microbacteriaceae bacterium VKM Ac-2854]|nr:hypothetical protein [Microbacteriaceae bacterium VKM Ac-2854]
MRRPAWTALTIGYALVLIAAAVTPTWYSLQFRFGYAMTEETLPVLVFSNLLSTLSAPCAVVGTGTLFALLAVRLLTPKPERRPEPDPLAEDLDYRLERDPR